MSKLRVGLGAGRAQHVPAGAFGRAPSRARERVVEFDEEDSEAAERARIRDILLAEYSWEELQQISANMRRDMERRREIEEMFAELDGTSLLEDELFKIYKVRLAKQGTRYQQRKRDPRFVAQDRARSLKYYHENKKARTAAHKAWLLRSRVERTEAYLRMLERWRKRYREADEAQREKWRKASRDCMKRKRDRLKREDPAAYRALLDARNAKRKPKSGRRAAPRFGSGRSRPRTSAEQCALYKSRLRADPAAYRAYLDRQNELRRKRRPKRTKASLEAERKRQREWERNKLKELRADPPAYRAYLDRQNQSKRKRYRELRQAA